MAAGSQLFCPFRALGFVANHVPLNVQTQGTENLVTTAVGSAFHVYDCAKLNLLFVGLLKSGEISCLLSHGDLVITASENIIVSWKRGKKVVEFAGHKSNIHFMLSFGSHLISVDEQSTVRVWIVQTQELYLEMEFNPENFYVTCLMHPSTYLNKILLCSRQGQMQLWNIKTNKLIYTFLGWSVPITAIEQAPAVDVVGVGLQSGKLLLHNLKFDETVMSFQQDWGPVTALAFRTDGNPVMASASTEGHIAFWDLEKRQLGTVLRDSHKGMVCGMKFLPSQPLLVTNGPDNSVKIWIFDQPDASGRLLRSRSSHSAPPTKIRFYSGRGTDLLSAGLDRTLRFICTVRDARSCELSQGSLTKKSKSRGVKLEDLKLPPVIDFASEDVRQSAWDNIVTCHQGVSEARTWSFQRKSIGKHHLKSQADVKCGPVMTTTMSSCGNFAITGDAHGHVHMFNIQSGIHRGCLGTPKAHSGQVRGVAIDGLNQQVITAGADRNLKFWNFKARKLLYTLTFEAPVTQILLHRESSLLAVSLDDFEIHVVDIDMRRVVRIFRGHTNRVTDMAFSPDSRWLITSSMDSSVRTWDLPAARLIDCFLVESPVTSLAMSPVADFLVTTHVDDLGIYLWSNKTLYDDVSLVPLPVDYQPTVEQLPGTITGTSEDNGVRCKSLLCMASCSWLNMQIPCGLTPCERLLMLDILSGRFREMRRCNIANQMHQRTHQDFEDENETPSTTGGEDKPAADNNKIGFKSPDQLSDELVTLSLLPQSRWRHLTSLELIKQRNKPKEPPQAPKAAPFFLPTTQELVPRFLPTEGDQPDDMEGKSKILNMKKLQPDSEFQRLLKDCANTEDYEAVLALLKSMGPSSVDAEMRCLGPSAGGDIKLLELFMLFIEHQINTRRDFELTEAYLALFLKLHGAVIAENPVLTTIARRLQQEHSMAWSNVRDLLNQCSCLVSYFKSAVI